MKYKFRYKPFEEKEEQKESIYNGESFEIMKTKNPKFVGKPQHWLFSRTPMQWAKRKGILVEKKD